MNDIEFIKGLYGTKAIIKTTWQDSFLKLLLDKDIKELELNIGKGWRRGEQQHLEFLKFFPDLESIIVGDFSKQNIESIHLLKKLKSLDLSTYCKTKIEFGKFPFLENCFIEWRKGCDSLFECKKLRSLGINNYKNTDSDSFDTLLSLERLTLLNASIEDLKGVFNLNKLTYLRIGNLKRLSSLKGIENLKNLETLEIQKCKAISTISEVFKLSKLKLFFFLDSGEINSITGIENLTELERFAFYESTNILDGDLTPLFKLKKLSEIAFQNRRHYSHKREDFGNLHA